MFSIVSLMAMEVIVNDPSQQLAAIYIYSVQLLSSPSVACFGFMLAGCGYHVCVCCLWNLFPLCHSIF